MDVPALLHAEWAAAAPSLDAFDRRVAARFADLLASPDALAAIPALSATTPATALPLGQLVRFRAMVQDTGLGSEVYRAVGSKGQILGYGIDETDDASAGVDDYANLRERQVLYLVTVPGETAWVKETLDSVPLSDLDAALENLALSSDAAPVLLAHKFPLPDEPHFGCIAKVYGDAADSLKTTDVREFVGVLSHTTFSSSFDELSNPDTPAPTAALPALHVLLSLPAPAPAAPFPPSTAQDVVDLRHAFVAYLAAALGGDEDAAEWVLLALLARIHTRHSTGLVLGSLSLNLALPPSFSATALLDALAAVLPTLTALPLSIPFLNDPATRLAPRNRDENLESGRLQLAEGTTVLVDTRGIGEGKLEDTGVRNLRHVATTIAQQKLAYQFPFSAFELDTNLNFLVLSEGKALIPTDCVVYVQPSTDFVTPPAPTADQLALFRSFLATMKHADFTIPAAMSEVIQTDFVDRRQKSVGGEAMTQEDLLFRMGAARLLTLSQGDTALSKAAWMRTAQLDDRRKERSPVVPPRKE